MNWEDHSRDVPKGLMPYLAEATMRGRILTWTMKRNLKSP